MTRVVRFESGWLARQIDSAQERASHYPTWLTNPQSGSQNRSSSSNSDSSDKDNSTAGQNEVPLIICSLALAEVLVRLASWLFSCSDFFQLPLTPPADRRPPPGKGRRPPRRALKTAQSA